MQDVKLIAKISDKILNLVIEGMNGKLDDVTLGDLQGIAEALAMNIINEVRKG